MPKLIRPEDAEAEAYGKGRYAKFGRELGALLEKKRKAYGASFDGAGAVLAILYPDGVTVEQYRDLLTITRVVDKLFRVANQKEAFGESPWRDIAGYATLACVADEEEVAGEEPVEDAAVEI